MNRFQLILIAALLVVSALYMRSCSVKDAKIDSQRSVINEQTAEIITVKVKGNKEAYQKQRAIADFKTLEDSYEYLSDTLKAMKIKEKELQSALFLAQQTTGSGSGEIHPLDTIIIKETDTLYVSSKLSVDERFFKFDANIFKDNSFDYEYRILDSLSIVNTTTRKNIFKKWEHNVRVLNANPNTELTGITSMTVKNREPIISIGISAGYGITPAGLQPFLGITATKSLISF